MHFETSVGGPFDERAAIYRSLLDETEAESVDPEERPPTDFACLGCGTVTTAEERPDSCPSCHRTPGDRRGGALFQSLD